MFKAYLERSSLTAAVSEARSGDTAPEEEEADLYMLGSWMERSDRAETVQYSAVQGWNNGQHHDIVTPRVLPQSFAELKLYDS